VTARTKCYLIKKKGALKTALIKNTKLKRKEGKKGKESAFYIHMLANCPWQF